MFAPEASQQTLQAQRDALGTQVAEARASATPQSARMQVTLEAAQTSAARSNLQTTRIAATLSALGTPFIDIRFITPEFAQLAAAPDSSAQVTGQDGVAIPQVMPTIIGQGGAQGNSSITAPSTPIPAAEQTVDPALPSLSNLTTADAVGADDCAAAPVTNFSAEAAGVYVVANAANLTPANTLTARWSFAGTEQITYDWTPGFNITQGCIWFYMPATDVAFSPGGWAVQIDLDGAPGQPINFTVGETGDGAAAMQDGG
jgi:hypothetical protein